MNEGSLSFGVRSTALRRQPPACDTSGFDGKGWVPVEERRILERALSLTFSLGAGGANDLPH